MLNAHCHTVVKLPPYMCDLNPVELAWSEVKNYFHENNMTGLKWLMNITVEGVAAMTAKDWEGYC